MPIDIATGNVELARDDFVLPGRVPLPPVGAGIGSTTSGLNWTRHYSSALVAEASSPLGPGWTTSWFSTLKRVERTWRFAAPNGVNVFPDPDGLLEKGSVIRLPGAFLELTLQNNRYVVTHWDVESGEIRRFIFAANYATDAPPLMAVEDVSGDGVELEWDASGRISALRQRIQNRTIFVNYLPVGRISSLDLATTGGARTELVRYEYDAAGRLSAAFNRRDFANRYEYDANSHIFREILKDGAIYSYRYDNLGRCIYFSGLDRYNEKRLRFLDSANRTMVTDSNGKTTIYEHLPTGQIASEVDPAGNYRRTIFDRYNRIVSKVEPDGSTTSYTYDEHGNRDSITDPLGNTHRFTFNEYHQPVVSTDRMGNRWVREYDVRNRLVSTQDPLGARWTFEYDEAGNPAVIIDPLGSHRRQRFSNGLPRETTDWMGNITQFKWDNFGNLIERIGPVGERSAFRYDPAGNLIEVELADGGRFRAAYDSGDNLSMFMDSKRQATHFRYGSCRRLLERVDPMGRVVRYQWGTEVDQLEAVINEKGERFSYVRDDLGRVVREKSFDGRERSFEYDASDRCIAMINGNGDRIDSTRDAVGRLVRQTLPDGTVTTFEYDQVGRIVKANNPDMTVEFEYDAAGRLMIETQGDHWVRSWYDETGEVIRTNTSLGHDVRYELDPNGLVKKVITAKNDSLSFGRDPRGLETARLMPGGIQMEQRFDSMGRLIEQQIAGFMGSSSEEPRILTGWEVMKRSYRYDADDLLLSTADGRWGTTEYAYDPTERLLRALRDGGVSERFDYDLTGNLTRAEQSDETTDTEFTYSSGNRLLTRGDTRYEYDLDGRLVRKTEAAASDAPRLWEYAWDALGQLRRIRRPDGQEWVYKYDAFGRRVAKSGPSGDRDFLWDGGAIVHEMPKGDHPVGWIIPRGSFVPLAKVQDGALYPILTDQLGTPREMLDPSGIVVWATSLTAWGRVNRQQNAETEHDCPFRFQGQWFDEESGLHYNRYRYYDPAAARFLSSDPIELDGSYWEKSTTNLYEYTVNPITWLDPLGLAAKSCGDKKPRSTRPIGARNRFSSRKAAREAAEHSSPIGQAVAHPDTGHGPHYHPLDAKGNPTHDHYYFPKRQW